MGVEDRLQSSPKFELTDDERFEQVCIQTPRATRIEPHILAREGKEWSRDQWFEAELNCKLRQVQRWSKAEEAFEA